LGWLNTLARWHITALLTCIAVCRQAATATRVNRDALRVPRLSSFKQKQGIRGRHAKSSAPTPSYFARIAASANWRPMWLVY